MRRQRRGRRMIDGLAVASLAMFVLFAGMWAVGAVRAVAYSRKSLVESGGVQMAKVWRVTLLRHGAEWMSFRSDLPLNRTPVGGGGVTTNDLAVGVKQLVRNVPPGLSYAEPRAAFWGLGGKSGKPLGMSPVSYGEDMKSPLPQSGRLFYVPHIIPLAVFAVLPSVWSVRRRRRAIRVRRGLCSECGYDVRAAREQCPECGIELAKIERRGVQPELV